MAKVTEMIGDYAHPAGQSGRGVDIDTAITVAGEMRQILNMDLEEVDIALKAYLFNRQCDSEQLVAAWDYLNAGERRAWRTYVSMGKC